MFTLLNTILGSEFDFLSGVLLASVLGLIGLRALLPVCGLTIRWPASGLMPRLCITGERITPFLSNELRSDSESVWGKAKRIL